MFKMVLGGSKLDNERINSKWYLDQSIDTQSKVQQQLEWPSQGSSLFLSPVVHIYIIVYSIRKEC